jgi:hypothetical protein
LTNRPGPVILMLLGLDSVPRLDGLRVGKAALNMRHFPYD